MLKIETYRSGALITMRTEGLSAIGYPDILVDFNDAELTSEAETFLNYVSDYMIKSRAKLWAGETMVFGYWIIRFQDAGAHKICRW